MHLFNQLYCIIIESTRRNFLKQGIGTIAAAAMPSNNIADPISNIATPFDKVSYDLTNAGIQNMIADAWDESSKEYTMHQLQKKASELMQRIKTGNISSKTYRRLLSYSSNLDANVSSVMQKIASSIKDADVQKQALDDIADFADDDLADLVDSFKSDESEFLFDILPPGNITMNGNMVMSHQQAISQKIFKHPHEVLQALHDEVDQIASSAEYQVAAYNNAKKTKHHIQAQDAINYTPMDYKGGWQHDADYESLSMGESFNAVKI